MAREIIPNYTVQRINKQDGLYGPTHCSEEAEETLCGLIVDHNWHILTTDQTGMPTCKKCLEQMPGGAKRRNL